MNSKTMDYTFSATFVDCPQNGDEIKRAFNDLVDEAMELVDTLPARVEFFVSPRVLDDDPAIQNRRIAIKLRDVPMESVKPAFQGRAKMFDELNASLEVKDDPK